jgi:tricarballylate dehydrogenase
MLRSEEYDMPGATEYVADTLEDLAGHMSVDPKALAETVAAFNAGIDISTSFDPSVKDHRTSRVRPLKSNWAVAIDQPPFHAFPVTCGITFTFGGLAADSHGRVLDGDPQPDRGTIRMRGDARRPVHRELPERNRPDLGHVFGRRCGNLA